jgi:hypothetical protein
VSELFFFFFCACFGVWLYVSVHSVVVLVSAIKELNCTVWLGESVGLNRVCIDFVLHFCLSSFLLAPKASHIQFNSEGGNITGRPNKLNIGGSCVYKT